MKKRVLAALCSSLCFTQPALADNDIEKIVGLLSGKQTVQYLVQSNPAAELHLQTVEYSVELPGNVFYTLEFDSNEVKETSGSLYLRDTQGDVQGSLSVSRKGNLQGYITTPSGEFKIISVKDKLVVMEVKRPLGLSEEAEQELMKHPSRSFGSVSLPSRLSRTSAISSSQTRTLRLSLYYTNDVAKFLEGIGADPKEYLEFYIDRTNQAYKNSGINVSVEIANVTGVDYDEFNPLYSAVDFWLSEGENLNKLKLLFPDDDYVWERSEMDEELKQSEKYGSDMDMLFTDLREGYCGVAQVIGAELRDQSMAVTNIHCLSGNTLPHEMGHLFGAEHNWEATAEVPFRAQYAHGYYDAQDWSFRTIMSYSCVTSAGGPKECPRINFFSTPRKEFNGKYIGTADEHDNARQHNEWAPLLTNLSAGADCEQFNPWQLHNAYQKGAEVVKDGMLYRANWWSYNDNPSTASSKSEWKQVWQQLTNCR